MTTQIDRFYIRCADCLSIGVIEGEYARGWTCSVCAGPIELMGRVVEDKRKYEVGEERSACDRRCTHAVGPICVCKCNCANHGTGRVVTVNRLRDIPQVEFTQPEENAQQLALAFRAAKLELQQLLDTLRTLGRDYSQPYDERRIAGTKTWYGGAALKKAIEARTWKARHKHLAQAEHIVATGEVTRGR